MLPFLRDRPLVLDRYPDGIAGKSFFQKNAPETAPGDCALTLQIGGLGQEIDYLLCDDVGRPALPGEPGGDPVPRLVEPGRIDRPAGLVHPRPRPEDGPFAHVVRIALAVRELCEEIGLPSFVKTSGGSGLHILLPMAACSRTSQCASSPSCSRG